LTCNYLGVFGSLMSLLSLKTPRLLWVALKPTPLFLMPYIPTTYKSPVDLADLGTMWLGYIPSDVVDVLAAEIKAKQSKFYTGVPGGIATDLADRVNAGSNLRSVSDNGGTSGTSGSTIGGDGVTGATNADSKSRQDAIIGIVSVLGAIALLVLVFLVHRSMKRSGLVK